MPVYFWVRPSFGLQEMSSKIVCFLIRAYRKWKKKYFLDFPCLQCFRWPLPFNYMMYILLHVVLVYAVSLLCFAGIGSDKYQTINRHEPLESTKQILREQMSLEYEFYNFVLDKFHRLKKELGVSWRWCRNIVCVRFNNQYCRKVGALCEYIQRELIQGPNEGYLSK